MLNVIMLSVMILSVIILSVIMLSVVMLSVTILNVIMLSVIILCVIILSVIILNVIMLSVVILNVVAPFFPSFQARFLARGYKSFLLSFSQRRNKLECLALTNYFFPHLNRLLHLGRLHFTEQRYAWEEVITKY